ncbi:nitroreductase family protein [Geomonas nitrogeniifigens]|uniref:Nitroreductase family protein n=1 Tax=Geomonas diazotrophica TaxID=2843197 RepID=A0ABX8JCN5_9BACT|nr:nitroreductase family protein [Geomonas nitrogeniifigens]QWV96140.1 nitroreductase family protein [Geomonas nitrogeniifigens]QXE85207.1 nitroreductase family protein [Geomonas nitrogeniifigens]
MDVFQAINDRRSIRKYRDTPVEWDKVSQVLDAGRLAPSWKNMQCWRFLVLSAAGKRNALLDAFPDDNPGKKALAQAPVTIVVCADPAQSGVENGIEYYVADTAIAFEHICLAAHGLGLGTCWMGLFDEPTLKESLGIPAGMRVVGVTPLGYPDQEPKARPRKELAEIAYHNDWGKAC